MNIQETLRARTTIHNLARQEADEAWALVDEFTAMASRAELRAEEASQRLEEIQAAAELLEANTDNHKVAV